MDNNRKAVRFNGRVDGEEQAFSQGAATPSRGLLMQHRDKHFAVVHLWSRFPPLRGGQMKAMPITLSLVLALTGCGNDDLDSPATLESVAAAALDDAKVQRRFINGEEVVFRPNDNTPYTGWAKKLYNDQSLALLCHFKDGKLDGEFVSWYENGQKRSRGSFINGKLTGHWTEWHENGQKESDRSFKDGQPQGQWTAWYENGQKEFDRNYKDGKPHGVWASWQKNGYQKERAIFSDGTLEGSKEIWDENGQKEETGMVQMNSIGMQLVLVREGTFNMGSPVDEASHTSDEQVHSVVITQRFFIGAHEVTQQQFEQVMRYNPSLFKGPNLPVENLTWDEATDFCDKLSQMEGKKYRLPTEAEWEYACRAGTTSAFYCGPSLSSTQANFNGNYPYGDAKKGIYLERTTPVGSYDANAFKLFDTHGNVMEWCADWYGNDYYAASPKMDPQGPGKAYRRVARGGGWNYHASKCRSASRREFLPTTRLNYLGFRVVRERYVEK